MDRISFNRAAVQFLQEAGRCARGVLALHQTTGTSAPQGPASDNAQQGLWWLSARRLAAWVLVDVLASLIASLVTVANRFETLDVETYRVLLPWVLLPVIMFPAANLLSGVYQLSWRRLATRSVLHLAASVTITMVIEVLLFYAVVTPAGLAGAAGFPRSYWLVQAVDFVALALASRTLRVTLERRYRAQFRDRRHGTRTLLYGAGEAGVAVLAESSASPAPGMYPVGFLDDDMRLRGQHVAGLRVYGNYANLQQTALRLQATNVLITMPRADGNAVRRVVHAAAAAGLSIKTLPSIGELIRGSLSPARSRTLNLEDLLRRPISPLDRQRTRALVGGTRVLVTGAAGSIGSEILRQVLDAGPSLIVAFDQAESPLYELEREILDRIADAGGVAPAVAIELGSVSDGARLDDLFARHTVDVVIHAAAYKHVPMLERHPSEAVVTNLGGTLELLQRARTAGVSRFVLISTDKAVDPTSVMGATKRLAEMAMVAAGRRTGWGAVGVRFGNVLGSAGSVVPIFQRQIARGAPLTITHLDATRFFMTIPEASSLVLAAASMGGSGRTYILKMGEPVRIVDLARDVIRLAGLTEHDVEIKYTGLRPGERLHETLFYEAEAVEPTADDRILGAMLKDPPLHTLVRLRSFVDQARQRRVTGDEVLELARELAG